MKRKFEARIRQTIANCTEFRQEVSRLNSKVRAVSKERDELIRHADKDTEALEQMTLTITEMAERIKSLQAEIKALQPNKSRKDKDKKSKSTSNVTRPA